MGRMRVNFINLVLRLFQKRNLLITLSCSLIFHTLLTKIVKCLAIKLQQPGTKILIRRQ